MTIARKKPLRRSSKPLKRGRVRPRNAKRRASEFARCYGSKERVAFVKNLPCIKCGRTPCDNAHVPTKSGMGRKGPYTAIVPLCSDSYFSKGHHAMLHDFGRELFEFHTGIDLDAVAAATERAWRRVSQEGESE